MTVGQWVLEETEVGRKWSLLSTCTIVAKVLVALESGTSLCVLMKLQTAVAKDVNIGVGLARNNEIVFAISSVTEYGPPT